RHRDDARHVLGRPRLVIGTQNPQAIVVLVHRTYEAIGERLHALAVLGGARDDLVVDVGDVADEDDLVAAITEIAAHDVERHLRARVPDVAEVVDRIAAHVHAHGAGLERFELLLAAGQRIEDLYGTHRARVAGCSVRSPRLSA